MKCCVCGGEVEKPLRAPQGVVLCSKSCFASWKLTIIVAVQFKEIAEWMRQNYEEEYGEKLPEFPPNERTRGEFKRLMSTYNWIMKNEERTCRQYIT